VQGWGRKEEILIQLRVLQTAKKMQRREGGDFGTV
jgi:hypothetical protein